MEANPPHLQSHQLDKIFPNDIVSITVGDTASCSLYRQDYESMLPKRWLRTGVLDLGLKLLLEQHREEARKVFAVRGEFNEQEHSEYVKLMDGFITTLIMGSEDDFILQSLKPLNLFAPHTKYLIIPLNTEYAHGSHWLLALLQNGNHKDTPWKLWLFDSGQSSQHLGRTLTKKLQKLHCLFQQPEQPIQESASSKQEAEHRQIKIELQSPPAVPYQSNNYDCGIYTLAFGEYVLLEILNELQDGGLQVDRLGSQYRYLIGNSAQARDRYRGMVQRVLEKQMQ